MTVLVVDDNTRFLQVVSDFLAGFPEVEVVGTATGGEAGLAQAIELRPEVVLLDLAMPDVTGLEVIPRLRALLPESGIVVLTFLEADCYRQAAMATGADRFVAKSRIDTDLVPEILEAAGRSRAHGSSRG